MEAKRHYNINFLEIFEDESKSKLIVTQVVVQQFWGTLKNALSNEEIIQTFKTREVLLELHTKLEDFVDTRIKVGNCQQLVKEKYGALDFLESS